MEIAILCLIVLLIIGFLALYIRTKKLITVVTLMSDIQKSNYDKIKSLKHRISVLETINENKG